MNILEILKVAMLRGGVRGLAGPVLIVMILSMMVLPLPPFLLDILFTFNIALAIMVLLVAMIGAIVLIVFFVLDSQPGTNAYGPNPKETAAPA